MKKEVITKIDKEIEYTNIERLINIWLQNNRYLNSLKENKKEIRLLRNKIAEINKENKNLIKWNKSKTDLLNNTIGRNFEIIKENYELKENLNRKNFAFSVVVLSSFLLIVDIVILLFKFYY